MDSIDTALQEMNMSCDGDCNAIELSIEQCEQIFELCGPRVAKSVIQAIYSIMDISHDYPASHLIRGLIPAVNKLIQFSTGKARENGKLAVYKDHQVENINACLDGATALLRAARQRVAGIHATREFNSLPFEVIPPCVHLFYQTCEFVVRCVLKKFYVEEYEMYIPYVAVESVDGPKHEYFHILMPEHRLFDSSIYCGLAHESFHAFVTSNPDILYKDEKILAYCKDDTNLLTAYMEEREKYKLLEEFIVEILEFELSFLEDYEAYIYAKCKHYGRYLIEFKVEGGVDTSSGKHVTMDDIFVYVLRTLFVKIWCLYRNPDNSHFFCKRPSMLKEAPSDLRNIISEHLYDFKDMLSQECKGIASIYIDRQVLQIQRIISEMSDFIDGFFGKVDNIINKFDSLKILMKNEVCGENFKNNVQKISDGIVVNDVMQFPHLVIAAVDRVCYNERDNEDNRDKEKVAVTALLMSIWNAKNIIESEKK